MSVFSPEVKQQIEGFLGRYETKRSAILPILHVIQDHDQYVRDDHVRALEEEYGLSAVEVREVLTFYSMYRTSQPAKFRVLMCNNIVCMMLGAEVAIAKIQDRIAAYKASGKEVPFSVEGVPCLGVCDGAPAMLVNKERHLLVTDENVDDILDRYAPAP